MRVGHEKLGPFEKKHYLMALLTFASSEGAPDPRELEIVKTVSRELHGHVHESDVHAYDIGEIVRGVKHPEVQADLGAKMVEVGNAGGRWGPHELGLLKFFAEQWKQPLPALPNVDWATVAAPDQAAVAGQSQAKKKMVHAYWNTHLKSQAAARSSMSHAILALIVIAVAGAAFKLGYYDKSAHEQTRAVRAELLAIVASFSAGDNQALEEKRRTLEREAKAGGLPVPAMIASHDAKVYAAKTRLLAAALLPVESSLEGKRDRIKDDLHTLFNAREEVARYLVADPLYNSTGEIMDSFKPGTEASDSRGIEALQKACNQIGPD